MAIRWRVTLLFCNHAGKSKRAKFSRQPKLQLTYGNAPEAPASGQHFVPDQLLFCIEHRIVACIGSPTIGRKFTVESSTMDKL